MASEDEVDPRLEASFLFSTIKLGEFPPPPNGSVVTVPSDMMLVDAVKILTAENILACPVRDVTQPDDAPWMDKYLGMLDMVGIAFFVFEKVKGKLVSLQDHELIRTTRVSDLVGTARFGPFMPLDTTQTLLDAMLLMGKYGLHRIPIVKSPGGDVVNMITQSAIVDQLARNMNQFPRIARKTMAEVGLAVPNEVFSTRADESLLSALSILSERHLSAIPVLGFGDSVVGNVSARDVRTLILDETLYPLLKQPVRQFLNAVSAVEHEAMNPAITCRATDTMEHVILQISASRIHRVYMCDERNHALRVISLSDLLEKFVLEPSADYFELPPASMQ